MLRWLVISLSILTCSCQKQDKTVVIFGGDVMLDRGIRRYIEKKGVDELTEGIRPVLKAADFAVINLECPATEVHAPIHKKFVFRAEPAWLPGLRSAGITHCILANNHSYDHGREGIIATARNLENAGIVPTGFGNEQASACEPVILEKNGNTIALFSSVLLTLEAWMYLEDLPGMCQATADDLSVKIAEYHQKHPEHFIVVTLHWGLEYRPVPTNMQRMQARKLVEAGADVIIGHHPHVVQSFENVMGKPVFYSIGNLIFDNKNPSTHKGILVKLEVKNSKGKVEIIPYKSELLRPELQDTGEQQAWLEELQQYSDPLPGTTN